MSFEQQQQNQVFFILIPADVPESNEVSVQDNPWRNPEVLATDRARLSAMMFPSIVIKGLFFYLNIKKKKKKKELAFPYKISLVLSSKKSLYFYCSQIKVKLNIANLILSKW